MNTSRHYKNLRIYPSLSDYVGIHHTVALADMILDEAAHWASYLIPTDKINMLHVKSISRATSLEFDVLFRVLTKDKSGEVLRKKQEIVQKEKEEIQAEEAIVKSLLMEQ